MGKSPKQFHEGHWYHVYARSLPELSLFESSEEREWFLARLDDVFVRRNVAIGAFCLMDSHYHSLVKMGSVRLDQVLNSLHMSYAKHINHERDRRGSVFEKHPGTDIILDNSYLLQLVPYIHNNPVEAGMVDDPSEYEWSTDARYRNREEAFDDLESWEWPPNFKGSDRERVYKERMQEEGDIPRSNDGYVGTERQWLDLEKRDESRKDRYRDRRGRPSKEAIANRYVSDTDVTVEDLKNPGRKQPEARIRQEAMVTMYEEGYGPTEIGEFFGRDKGAVLYAVRKLEDDRN